VETRKQRHPSTVIIQSPTTVPFPVLQPEVRNRVYALSIRPDLKTFYYDREQGWFNDGGTINFLGLSRQIYRETFPIFQSMEVGVQLHGRGISIFRHPLANGQPGLFLMSCRNSACYVPPNLTEIDFVRLRRMTLNIQWTCRRTHRRWRDVISRYLGCDEGSS